MLKNLLLLIPLVLLSGCSWLDKITPTRPEMALPSAFEVPEGFKWATPSDPPMTQAWWTRYRDEELNALEARVPKANQSLAQADAQYRQALAATEAVRASLFPTVNLNLSTTRSQSPIATTSGTLAQPPANNMFQTGFVASWVPDLWGQVHDNVAASEASNQAAAANRAAILLSLQSQLAIDYFALRVSDAQIELLKQTVSALDRNLELTEARFKAGIAAKSDVTQARGQLESTRASLADALVNRATLEHAIAVLIGENPALFHLQEAPWHNPEWPSVRLGIPSQLLERRPDIANAERQLNATAHSLNASQAAFFPVLTLNVQSGFETRQLPTLLSLPHSFWSIGPQLTQYLLDGGLRTAQRDQALAALETQTANYRQVVLTAFQQVEDNLSTLTHLSEEESRHRAAQAAAEETLDLVMAQYKAGTADYLQVVTAETALITAESSVLADVSREAAAHIQLVTALGGDIKE